MFYKNVWQKVRKFLHIVKLSNDYKKKDYEKRAIENKINIKK